MSTPSHPGSRPPGPRPFLGVHFVQCGAYGRFYRNPEGTAYLGRCPKCGRPYRIPIGVNGTRNRFFKAHCHG